MSVERVEQKPRLEIVTTYTIDERYIDRYRHLWHLGSLALFEEERYRILVERAIGSDVIESEHGLRVLVAGIRDVEYKGEVHQGDVVDIRSKLNNTPATLWVDQSMEKQGLVVVQASYRLGFVDDRGRPHKIPTPIMDRLYGTA